METNTENTQIQLVQKPEFKHELIALGQSIKERIEGLNLPAMVANEDTIQTLKKLHADFNKEEKQVDDNFKEAIAPATSVIDEIKAIKKEHINSVYSWGRGILKDEITKFEIEVKTEKKNAVIAYFNELCAAEKNDWLKFEQLGIEINLSTTVNKYIDQVYSFVMRVGDDINLIKSLEYAAETLTEYKGNGLNASLAISKVKTRKDAEKLEEQRLKQKEIDRREGLLRGLSMVYRDITNTFDYVGDNSIFIAQSEINGLNNEEFTKLFVTLESRINAAKEASKPKVTAAPPQSVKIGLFDDSNNNEKEAIQIHRQNELVNLGLRFDGQSFIYKDINFHFTDLLTMSGPAFAKALQGAKDRMMQLKTEESTPQPLPAPVEAATVVEEKKIFARFEVSGTRDQLLALGQYMKSNNLVYTNIKQ